jgi:hypothetical protein
MKRTVAAAIAALAIAPAACGGAGEGGTGTLRWERPPALVLAPGLPRDRVVVGTVKNDSLRKVELEASRLRVVDGDRRRLRTQARFAAAYAHGLYGADYRPQTPPEDEQERLGIVVALDPGESAPLNVAYRLPKRTRGALAIDYGEGSLPVPRRVRRR